MPAVLKKALLKVGYACNNRCVFCHSAPHRGQDSPLEDIRRKIEAAAQLGADMLVLSGGEPTIRKDLLQITAIIRENGMQFGLVTNGRMLAYRGLVDRLMTDRLGYAYVSICGPSADIHDRHTGIESFNQTLKGMRNLSGKIDDLTINIVITSINLPHLGRMTDLMMPPGSGSLKLSAIEPEGAALDAFEALVPPLTEAARAAVAVNYDRLVWDGFPLCLIPRELWGRESGLREDGFFIMSEAFEKEWYPVDDANRSFGDCCLECSLRRRCRGVYSQYLLHRGEGELRPDSTPVSNSFNFEPAAEPIALNPEDCQIRAGKQPPPDPVRGLLVPAAGRLFQPYLASTRDFSDATIAHSVRDLGQVYRSRTADKPEPDIKSDLERLQLSAACRQCPKRPLCGGAWVSTGDDGGFTRFNQWLQRLLSKLSGSVLDIGCGQVPYLQAFTGGLSQGTLSYLGIDPSQGPSQLPDGAEFVRSDFDDFEWSGPSFDNVLSLRSLDHLSSPGESILKMAELCAPGGSVLLAEDDVFGVVRNQRALTAIKADPSLTFEHLCNLRLDEAKQLALRAGLRPLRWFSSGENGCTTWLLECIRESP